MVLMMKSVLCSVAFCLLHVGAGIEQLCLLSPVHEPHFGMLAKMLAEIHRLSLGPPVHFYVIADTAADYDSLTELLGRAYPQLSNALGDFVHGIPLESLFTVYAPGVDFLEYHAKYALNREKDPTKCFTYNRAYASMKKMLGVVHLEEWCEYVWVVDADSRPFRPFHFIDDILTPWLAGGKHIVVADTWDNISMANPSGDSLDSRCNRDALQFFNRKTCTPIDTVLADGTPVDAYGKEAGRCSFDGFSFRQNDFWIYEPHWMRTMVEMAQGVWNGPLPSFFPSQVIAGEAQIYPMFLSMHVIEYTKIIVPRAYEEVLPCIQASRSSVRQLPHINPRDQAYGILSWAMGLGLSALVPMRRIERKETYTGLKSQLWRAQPMF